VRGPRAPRASQLLHSGWSVMALSALTAERVNIRTARRAPFHRGAAPGNKASGRSQPEGGPVGGDHDEQHRQQARPAFLWRTMSPSPLWASASKTNDPHESRPVKGPRRLLASLAAGPLPGTNKIARNNIRTNIDTRSIASRHCAQLFQYWNRPGVSPAPALRLSDVGPPVGGSGASCGRVFQRWHR
jgi:hypothetical protein